MISQTIEITHATVSDRIYARFPIVLLRQIFNATDSGEV